MAKFKVIISLICAIACLLVTGFVPATTAVAEGGSTNLQEIFPADFGIDSGVVNAWLPYTYKNGSLLNTIFTTDIKSNGGGTRNCFFYASNGDWHGLVFHFDDRNGQKSFYLGDSSQQIMTGSYEFNSQIAGVDFCNDIFRLQVSLEACDSDNDKNNDDLKVGVYFNYQLYNNTFLYFVDSASKIGNNIVSRPNVDGVANLDASIEIVSPQMKEIYPSDFGIDDGVYISSKDETYKNGNSLLNTVFTADIKHTGTLNCIYYASKSSNSWGGLVFHFTNEKIELRDPTYEIFSQNYVFEEETAGVEFDGEPFRLSVSIEVCDSDKNGFYNDLKVGVYFNGKLYNNTYIYMLDAVSRIGKDIHVRPNVMGIAWEDSILQIYSPHKSNVENYKKISAADFGILDGTHNGVSADMNVGLAGKHFSSNVSLKNAGDYIDYNGIRLQTNEIGAITVSDSTGNNSFKSENIYTDISDLKVISPDDFSMDYGTYTGAGNVVGNYESSLDNTYFTTKIKYNNTGVIPSICYGCTGRNGDLWSGLQINFTPQNITVANTLTLTTDYVITAEDVGFNLMADDWSIGFDLGISTRYGDYDNDGKRDDLQYGIFISGKLVQNRYVYVMDFADTSDNTEGRQALGRSINVYTTSSAGLKLTKPTIFPSLDTEDFDLQIVTKEVDSDVDGKIDDLKADIYIDDNLVLSPVIENYITENKLSGKLELKGTVKSPEKQISYKSDVVTLPEADKNGGTVSNAFEDSVVFSENVEVSDNATLAVSINNDASRLTLEDFGVLDGTYYSNNTASAALNGDLDDYYFSAKLKFINNAMLYYGGTAAKKGISFTYASNELLIKNAKGTLIERVNASDVGVGSTFLNTEFTLGITSKISGKDLLFSVWFNGVFYKTFTVTNGASSFGRYITLTSNSSTYKIEAKSYKASFPNAEGAVIPSGVSSEILANCNISVVGNTLNITGDFNGVADIKNSRFGLDFEFNKVALDNDGVKNDAVVALFVDGKALNNASYFIKDIDGELSPSFTVTANGAELSPRLPEESVEEKLYSLHQGDFLLSGTGNIYINRENNHRTGEKISTVGEYVIVREHCGEEYAQRVNLWKVGYINSDNKFNVLDFIKATQYIAGEDTATYIKKGADLDFDGKVSAKDIVKIKRILLGVGEMPTETLNDKWSFKEDTMPIVGFFAPTISYIEASSKNITPNLCTDEVYKAIKDCGFNFLSYIENYFENHNKMGNLKNLEMASKYGLGALVLRNDYGSNLWPESFSAVASEYFSHYSGYEGIVVCDEPHGDSYPFVTSGNTINAFVGRSGYTQYANMYGYTNLLPFGMGRELVGDTTLSEDEVLEEYKDYMREFCTKIKPKNLCWDYYVLNGTSEATYRRYYKNLSAGRQVAEEFGIPFWAFLQTHSQRGRINTKEEMLWNINTMLAYGLKGVQYYYLVQPYWEATTSAEDGTHDFEYEGVIAANGQKTEYYDHALAANTQIMAVDHVLMNSDSKAVLAIGNGASTETGLTASSYGALTRATATAERGAVIGCFDYRGKQAFYVSSNSFDEAQTVTLTFDTTHTMELISTNLNRTVTANRYNLSLGKGEAVLVVLD